MPPTSTKLDSRANNGAPQRCIGPCAAAPRTLLLGLAMFVTATVVVFTLKGGVLVTPDPSPSPPALNEVPEQLLVARTTARSPPSSRASAPPPASPAQPLLPLGLHVDLQLAPAGALDWAKLPLSVNYTLRSVIYNPALAMVDGRLHLFARHEGRHLSNEWRDCPTTSLHAPARACPVPSLRMVSFLVTAELDPASLQPIGKLREYEYPLDYTRAQRSVHHRELGPEDPRAFHWAEAAKDAAANVYVAYNGPPLGDKQVPSMLRSMKIQRILPAPPGPVVELYSKELQLGRYEKNWAPIMPSQDGEEFLFSRLLDPHEILGCRRDGLCQLVAVTSRADFFASWQRIWGTEALHLGTNAVRLPDGRFLAMFHGLALVGGRRYYNVFYTFAGPEDNFRIQAVAREPHELPLGNTTQGFAFSTSLLLVSDRVVVGYNVKDRTCSFVVLSLSDILATLQPIPNGTA